MTNNLELNTSEGVRILEPELAKILTDAQLRSWYEGNSVETLGISPMAVINTKYESLADWTKMESYDWMILLITHTAKYDHLCNWEIINATHASIIVKYRNDLAGHIPWRLYSSRSIVRIFCKFPVLLGPLVPWDLVNVADRVKALSQHPLSISHIPTNDFSGADWVKVLRTAPDLEWHVNWNVLTEQDFTELLTFFPFKRTVFTSPTIWQTIRNTIYRLINKKVD